MIQRTLSAGIMHETTKGRRWDLLPVKGEAYDIMERLTENRFGLEYMFINSKTRRGYKTNYLRKLWRTYGKPHWPHLTLYEMMRVTTITEWARSGKNAFQIMNSARHQDVKTSEGYVRLSGRDIAEVINYRDNLFELPEDDGYENFPMRSRKPKQGMD